MKKWSGTLAILTIAYLAYAWMFLAADSSRPILAIVTDDSYRQIPRFVAKSYLELTDYSIANGEISGSPPIPYLATGYNLGGFHNQEILFLMDKFLDRGADINAKYEGYTAINGAILGNSPRLIAFLLNKGADTSIVVDREGVEKCNLLASLEFAQCINNIGTVDLTGVINALQSKT